MLWPGGVLLLTGCALLAACGGAGAPAGPPGTLVLHGPAGARTLAAEDARRADLLAEIDSLLASPGDLLLLAVEPAALGAARGAGALELRRQGASEWTLAGGRALRAARLLVPLSDAVPSLRAGEGTLLLFLGESDEVLVAAYGVLRGRERLAGLVAAD